MGSYYNIPKAILFDQLNGDYTLSDPLTRRSPAESFLASGPQRQLSARCPGTPPSDILGLSRGYIGIMENKMETLRPFKGVYRVILGLYWDCGIMEITWKSTI